jgi:hypothetical protein
MGKIFKNIILGNNKIQYAVYEKIPAHGKEPDNIILGPFNSKKEAKLNGSKYGYTGDNYYIKEMKYE